MHTVYEKQEPFLARCLVLGHLEFLDPAEFAYVFTAGGARDFIVADLLTKHEFHPNCPYVRTVSGGLYALEKFTRLKDVMAVLPEQFFPGNRGVIVNADARRYLRMTSTIGVAVRIDKQHSTIEWIKLSREGLRESNRRQKLPPALRERLQERALHAAVEVLATGLEEAPSAPTGESAATQQTDTTCGQTEEIGSESDTERDRKS